MAILLRIECCQTFSRVRTGGIALHGFQPARLGLFGKPSQFVDFCGKPIGFREAFLRFRRVIERAFLLLLGGEVALFLLLEPVQEALRFLLPAHTSLGLGDAVNGVGAFRVKFECVPVGERGFLGVIRLHT